MAAGVGVGSEEVAPAAAAGGFAYDVFVVHAAADEWFVQGYLLRKLGLPPARVLVPRTLELGELLVSEIERGVRSSRVTIVVLSSAYLTDHWAVFGEKIAAYASVAEDGHGALIPLLRDDCELPVHIRALVKLDFRAPGRDAWDAESERLLRFLAQPPASAPDVACPYPGMRPFTAQDAPRFFGRDAELDRIVRWLRRGTREIYVIGASGSGKSSLVTAGLVPRLARGSDGTPVFHPRTLRPGEQPTERLTAALEGDPGDPASVTGLLARQAPAAALLVIIDQLEELFAASDDAQRRLFAALRALRADPRVTLVFTLRADFYGAFLASPLWTDRDGELARIDLGPPRGAELRVIIERPARDLGVYFQPELVSRLVDDAAQEPGALPLLQETLFQLWGKRRNHVLALADYQALGDGSRTALAFAVQQHADDVVGALRDAQRAIAFRILLRLINFGEGRADTRRQQASSALRSAGEADADFDAVLQRLVAHRLVTVTGDDQRADSRVDLAHEILIHAWPALADWIRTWRAAEQRRRELEAAAASWRARGGGTGGLFDPTELAGALAWRSKAAELGHSRDLAALLAASEAAQAHALQLRDRRRRAAAGQRALRNRLVREAAQLYQELGRERLIDTERPLEALPYLIEARANLEAVGSAPSATLRMLFAQATRNLPVAAPLVHQGAVCTAAFSPDGTRIVTASEDHTARVWDAASGAPVGHPLEHGFFVVSAAFSRDGTRILTASWDRTARVWDTSSGAAVSPALEHQELVRSAAFSPDGSRVVTTSEGKLARLWDAGSGAAVSPAVEHQDWIPFAAFSPDGSRLVTASVDHTAQVWDARSGEPVSPALRHDGAVVDAGFSPRGTHVVTASADGSARIWDASTGELLDPPLAHQDKVVSAAFSPDGDRVVTASADRSARVWDAGFRRPESPPLVHQGPVLGAAFSPDGSRVVTASQDHTARIWDAASGRPLSPPLAHGGSVRSAAFSPDGSRIVTASADETARVWDAACASPSLSPKLSRPRDVYRAAFSPGGARIITVGDDGTARVWDAATGQPVSPPLVHQGGVKGGAFSLDGTRVITASADRTARVWDVASGQPVSPPLEHRDAVSRGAFSPDGSRVVTASADRTARIWDVVSGASVAPPLDHGDAVVNAAFSPDGRRVLTVSADHTARVWDASSGQPVSRLLAHHDVIVSSAFSPDGSRVVTAAADIAQLWDAASGQPVSTPMSHRAGVMRARFSPDGTRIVTAGMDYTARVWDAASAQPVTPPCKHDNFVVDATFGHDGGRIVTASHDHSARIWDASSGKPLSPPLVHEDCVVSVGFSPDGARVVTFGMDGRVRIWDLPLASGTLDDWRAIAERASPFVLLHGVLSSKLATGVRPAWRQP